MMREASQLKKGEAISELKNILELIGEKVPLSCSAHLRHLWYKFEE